MVSTGAMICGALADFQLPQAVRRLILPSFHTTGYLEKQVSLAFRGTLRDLSIGVGGYKTTAYVTADHVPSPKPLSR